MFEMVYASLKTSILSFIRIRIMSSFPPRLRATSHMSSRRADFSVGRIGLEALHNLFSHAPEAAGGHKKPLITRGELKFVARFDEK
jgi:hypothetical protein